MGNLVEAIGQVQEFSGAATITRTDGSVEDVTLGTEVFQGDVVETSADGAVNITFTDESSFAVSEDASLIIDEYVFDPTTDEGVQNFSVLTGLFVYTSGLVGRDDPDDVTIEIPSGSIGIRGTIIAGDTDSGEITVVEGAIVLRDHDGNEMTLASQYETAKFEPGKGIANQGQLSANDVNERFSTISKVSPTLFSSVNDTAAEAANDAAKDAAEEAGADADGSVDQDGDNQVDGSVEEAGADAPAEVAEGVPADGADVPIAEAMPEAKPAMKAMAQEMMGDAMDGGMGHGEAKAATMEAMMEKMAEIRDNIKEAKNGEGNEDVAESMNDDTASEESSVSENIDTTLLNTQNEEQDIDLNLYVNAANNPLHAEQAGNILNGDNRINILRNVNSSTSQPEAGLSFNAGDGDDSIVVLMSNPAALNFGVIDGGDGIADTLSFINASGVVRGIDFSNVGEMKNIEVIDLGSGTGDDGVNLLMEVGDIFQNNSDEFIAGLGEVLFITGDVGDSLDIDFSGTDFTRVDDTYLNTSVTGVNPLNYEAYHSASEDVTLIVSENIDQSGVII